MKRIFVIDWVLIPAFALSFFTGLGLHAAGHGHHHGGWWHVWTFLHILTSLAFLIAVVFHVTTHQAWYRGIVRGGIGRKSKWTAGLSLLFPGLVITGLVLLGVKGMHSPVGLWHYKIGIATGVVAIGHGIARFPILRRSLNRSKS